MFNPSLTDVRMYFYNVWDKSSKKEPLDAMEKMLYTVIMEHPEYHFVLKNKQKYLLHNWPVELGETNPFLHMSMHVSILEQISINQPFGIVDIYNKLLLKIGNPHEALHQIMDCLAEMIWQSQYTNNQPNVDVYMTCLQNKL